MGNKCDASSLYESQMTAPPPACLDSGVAKRLAEMLRRSENKEEENKEEKKRFTTEVLAFREVSLFDPHWHGSTQEDEQSPTKMLFGSNKEENEAQRLMHWWQAWDKCVLNPKSGITVTLPAAQFPIPPHPVLTSTDARGRAAPTVTCRSYDAFGCAVGLDFQISPALLLSAKEFSVLVSLARSSPPRQPPRPSSRIFSSSSMSPSPPPPPPPPQQRQKQQLRPILAPL